jgi:SAM-dependent methyltransferase
MNSQPPDPSLRAEMKKFYQSSEIYVGFLETHDESYLLPYVQLITQYASKTSKDSHGSHSSQVSYILDLGCGNGLSSYLVSQKGHRVIGTDISPLFLKKAKSFDKNDNKTEYLKHVEYLACDALSLPFKAETFDLVCSNELIEHLPDVLSALLEMKRVLKNGGILIVMAPNLLSPIWQAVDLVRMLFGKEGRPIWGETKSQAIKAGIKNFIILTRKKFSSKVTFLYRQPDLKDRIIGGDADSSYLANTIDLERFLRLNGFKILRLCVGFGKRGRFIAKVCPRYGPYVSLVAEKIDEGMRGS